MIRQCNRADFDLIYEIINDAAEAYRGVIPADCWEEPYMSKDELQHEIADGVAFWGYDTGGELVGVMGIQPKGDVFLIRHAYVRTANRNQGIGNLLLNHLCALTVSPILVGTWAAASWAIRFYEKHGFCLVSTEEKDRLLLKYWNVPARQREVSVVLVDSKWLSKDEKKVEK